MVMKLAAEQASTSGTAIDFTSIPAGTSMIVVMFDGVSVNGASGHLSVQIGDSGGIETIGYVSHVGFFQNAGAVSYGDGSSGSKFLAAITSGNADNTIYGSIVLTLQDATNNAWVMSGGAMAVGTTPYFSSVAGRKALSAVLDRVRVLNSAGDTFDAGAISIAYF